MGDKVPKAELKELQVLCNESIKNHCLEGSIFVSNFQGKQGFVWGPLVSLPCHQSRSGLLASFGSVAQRSKTFHTAKLWGWYRGPGNKSHVGGIYSGKKKISPPVMKELGLELAGLQENSISTAVEHWGKNQACPMSQQQKWLCYGNHSCTRSFKDHSIEFDISERLKESLD